MGTHSRAYERAVVTGAGGWVGRCALDLLALVQPGAQLVAAASGARDIATDGHAYAAIATTDVPALPAGPRTLLLHAGFPTQDRVEAMGEGAYVDAITGLRTTMLEAITTLGPVDMVYLSSGAATSVARGLDVPHPTQVYGQAKLDDEVAFAGAIAATGGRLCMVRAFALSGPYMTKPEAYALGNMIRQASDHGRIEVRATRPVRRSYMAIDDMLRVAVHAVGSLGAGQSVMFETAGEVVEMGDLASRVLAVLGNDPDAVDRPPLDPALPADDYLGDPATLAPLAAAAGVAPMPLDQQIATSAEWLLHPVRSAE